MPGLSKLLGSSLVRLERCDPQYQDVFERLIEAEPEQPVWAIQLAHIHRGQEGFEAMRQVLQDCIERVPDLAVGTAGEESAGTGSTSLSVCSQVHRLLALAHANLQEFSEAVAQYQSLLAVTPDDPHAIIGLGKTYARMDPRTDEMDQVIARALELAPDAPLLNFSVGLHLAENADWPHATERFLKALEAGGEHVEMVLNQASALVARHHGAASVPARWLRVEALTRLGRFGELLDETEEIAALAPDEAQRVLSLFEGILRELPGNPDALFGKGRLLESIGRAHAARRSLEDALKQAPDYTPAKKVLIDVYEHLLEERDSTTLRFAHGQIAMQLGDYDRAVASFQKTRTDRGFERISRRHLAECFFHKRMYDLALQEFLNIAVDAQTKPMLYELGEECQKAGNITGARMAFQHIYSSDAAYKPAEGDRPDVAECLNGLTHLSEATASAGLTTPEGAQSFGHAHGVGQGETIDSAPTRYDLLEEIGHGAMASVYRARDNELEETVALKILPDNLLKNPEALRRFRLEARSARRLSHENIVRIHDIGEEQGRKYISMELVEGRSLKDIIRQTRSDTILDGDRSGIPLADLVRYAR